jgi:hypothetical protein
MRHHLLVPSCVVALVPSLISGAALAAPVRSATETVDVAFDPGAAGTTDRNLAAVPEPDSAGVWAALAGLAALAASRPAGGRRGR